jgi:hypothetical protein
MYDSLLCGYRNNGAEAAFYLWINDICHGVFPEGRQIRSVESESGFPPRILPGGGGGRV